MPGQSLVPMVRASAGSSQPEGWSSGMPRTDNVSWEGPFDMYTSPMDTGVSPLVATGLPGCPYRITSYTGPAVADTNPAFGMQLHHPRFLEFIGAPESARLLYHSPAFWVQRLGEENVLVAAVNLQRDAGLILSNLQIMSQFVTLMHRISTEMMSLGLGRLVFPSAEVAGLSTTPRAPGRQGTCQIWGCGVHRLVRAILGQCRLHPAMPALTVDTAFRKVRSLRQSDSASSMSSYDDFAWIMVLGACPWFCRIYIGLVIFFIMGCRWLFLCLTILSSDVFTVNSSLLLSDGPV